MRLRHEFRRAAGAGGGTRSLPDVDQPNGVLSVVGEMTYTKEAPGGPIDWVGTISEEEFNANPTYFAQGTLVLLFDEDDADVTYPDGRCIWGGEIDRSGVIEAGQVKLHAKGHGAEPDDVFNNFLWETRNEDRLVAGDSEPHEYDQDEQILARIVGRGIRLGWEKKALFLRATGESRLDTAAEKDDTSLDLTVNGGGLADAEQIHFGGESKTVHNSYTPDSTSIPLTSPVDAKHKAGTHVYWRANNAPAEWASGALMWVEGHDVNSVQIDIHLTRHAPAILEIRKATGPDGSTTLLDSIDCSAGAMDRTVEIESISGTPDLIYWRLVRTVQSDESGADRAFWAIVHDIRVRDKAGNTSDYKVHQVVGDIITAEGGEVGNVQTTSQNFMPLDGEGVSDADILDEGCVLTKKYWVKRRKLDGTGITWRFEAFGTRKAFELTQARAPVVPQALPRWNAVEVPYRRDHGLTGIVREYADPDPFPGEHIVKFIDLAIPPPEDLASAFALNAADIIAEEEQVARMEFSELEDPVDGTVPATRCQEGDTIEYDGYVYPASKLQGTGDGVVVMDSSLIKEGETGRPALDKVIMRRSLALARGASQAKATLGGFQLDIPNTPVTLEMGIREIERRGGKRKFDGILNCDNVTEDINGKGTAIQRYVGIFEFQDENDDWVLDDDGERMQLFRYSERKRSGDGAVIPAASKVIFKNLPHPHKWKVVGRMFCVDVFGEKSEVSEATPATKPATFGPNDPEDLELRANNRLVEADWERPDADENEGGDPTEPQLDNTVDRFRAKCFRWESGAWVKKGKTRKPRATACHWRREEFHVGDDIRVEVVSLDSYGNESNVVSEEITIGNDPNHHHDGGSHTHPFSGNHHHGHGGTHRHPKTHSHSFSGTHSHDRSHQHSFSGTHAHDRSHSHTHAGTHSHSKTHSHSHATTHRHTWNHEHSFSRHTGHGHSFVSDTHGHGGATTGFSANPGGVGNHNHNIDSAMHGHSFVSGGGHAHGQTSDADDAAEGTHGSERAIYTSTMQLQTPGSTDSDSAATGTIAPGDTDTASGNTGTQAPGSTDNNAGSTGTQSPGSSDSDTTQTDFTAPGDTDDAAAAGTSSGATGDTGDNVDD